MTRITAKAAVCTAHYASLSIQDVRLTDLQPEELRIRMVACGICHTDVAARNGQLPLPVPIVLGHEGAGIVEEVGSAVTVASSGDRVIMSFNSCGDCSNCAADRPTYCQNFVSHNWSGVRADGTPTLWLDGEQVAGNFFGQSSFATHAIAHQRNVVRVPDSAAHIPLETLAPLGCGLMTGAGSVLRSLQMRAGSSVVVFGTGTVGLAAIMAAKIIGAQHIIAVDMNRSRLDLALELGATQALVAEEGFVRIREEHPTGLDYAIDTTGRKAVIEGAFSLLAQGGAMGLVGVSDPADELSFNAMQLLIGGRTVKGILGGDSDIGPFIRELIEHHIAGRFPFDRLLAFSDFDQINDAIHAMAHGEVIKPVLRIGRE